MGYMHIDNLYKNQEILMFKECYAMEKIHGTSAHVSYLASEGVVKFFSGGENHERFKSLWIRDLSSRPDAIYSHDLLLEKMCEASAFTDGRITIYGEAYGGKQQSMSHTYGKELRFVAFDVQIGDCWLSVPDAADFCSEAGIDFVHWERVSTDIEVLNEVRDRPSFQAKRNGIEEDKPAEGVILRPLMELTKNNGKRIICKHKRDDFRETKTKREVSPERLTVLSEANEVASEWVTHMRLTHVLDKMPHDTDITNMRDIIHNMVEDVKREGEGEIEWSKEIEVAIGKATATLYKSILQSSLNK